MLFTSLDFLAFFLIVFGLTFYIQKTPKKLILLFSSYLFYASWDYRFLGLLILSTVVDFLLAPMAYQNKNIKKKKLALFISIIINIGVLCTFKYSNFFLTNFYELFSISEQSGRRLWLNLGVPIGISFYTFQTLSYTIDCYRNKLTPTKSLLDFSVFVAFFPQLLAGPIERAINLLPQLEKNPKNKLSMTHLKLISWGLFKKIVIADNLLPIVENILAQPTYVASELIIASFIMFLIVYIDFSAYGHIARGLAGLFGFNLMINFRPFFAAKNPEEFWRGWHISLTTWIQDYVYYPLLQLNLGKLGKTLCLFFVMFLVGLWHGASWNWILWGIFSGIYIVGFKLFKEVESSLSGLRHVFMISMYFFLGFWTICDSKEVFQKSIVGLTNWSQLGEAGIILSYTLVLLIPLIIFDSLQIKRKVETEDVIWPFFEPIWYGMIWSGILFLNLNQEASFFYFDF